MKIQFFNPRAIDGQVYSKGIHEVPDEKADHWYLLALFANGEAGMIEPPKNKAAQISPPIASEQATSVDPSLPVIPSEPVQSDQSEENLEPDYDDFEEESHEDDVESDHVDEAEESHEKEIKEKNPAKKPRKKKGK